MTDEQLEYMKKMAERDRQSRKACENCGWFARHQDEAIGECHRYPPSFPAMPELEWKHPRTSKDNVCGEFVHARTGDSFQLDPYRAVAVRLARAEEEIERLRRNGGAE